MALSKELLEYIGELEKIDKWDKLPKNRSADCEASRVIQKM